MHYYANFFPLSCFSSSEKDWPSITKKDSTLQADWVINTPLMLVNDGNPWVYFPKHCVFSYRKKNSVIDLDWKPIPKDIHTSLASYSYHPKFGVTYFDKNDVRASIPTFNAEKTSNLRSLKQLVNTAPQWRSKKIIVIDVRGNGGGNSEWGENILSQIYGSTYFTWTQDRHPDHTYEQWRTSKENLNFLKSTYIPYAKDSFGTNSLVYKHILNVVRHMESAIKMNHRLTTVNEIKFSPQTEIKKQPRSLAKGKVVIVIDGRCGSSCLTFIEQALNIPGIILVGAPTHADTYYTEIRFEKLPSGFVKFGFPMKTTRNRLRLNNQPYIPQHIFPNDINNTNELQRWIEEIVR